MLSCNRLLCTCLLLTYHLSRNLPLSFSPWLLKRFLISPQNKINLFCHIGMRLQTVEAGVRFRCAAVMGGWAWKQRPLPPGGQCCAWCPPSGQLGLCWNAVPTGWCLWKGAIRSQKVYSCLFLVLLKFQGVRWSKSWLSHSIYWWIRVT